MAEWRSARAWQRWMDKLAARTCDRIEARRFLAAITLSGLGKADAEYALRKRFRVTG